MILSVSTFMTLRVSILYLLAIASFYIHQCFRPPPRRRPASAVERFGPTHFYLLHAFWATPGRFCVLLPLAIWRSHPSDFSDNTRNAVSASTDVDCGCRMRAGFHRRCWSRNHLHHAILHNSRFLLGWRQLHVQCRLLLHRVRDCVILRWMFVDSLKQLLSHMTFSLFRQRGHVLNDQRQYQFGRLSELQCWFLRHFDGIHYMHPVCRW